MREPVATAPKNKNFEMVTENVTACLTRGRTPFPGNLILTGKFSFPYNRET